MNDWEGLAIAAYTKSRGRPPAWTYKDTWEIARLMQTPLGETLTVEAFLASFENFLKIGLTSKFGPERGGSISFFCRSYDSYAVAVEPKKDEPKQRDCSTCGNSRRVVVEHKKGRAPVTAPCQDCSREAGV